MINLSYIDVLISLSLILLTLSLSFWRGLQIEKDIIIGTIRTFLQLVIIGFLLEKIFSSKSALLIISIVFLMLLIATREAHRRQTKKSKESFKNIFFALTIASTFTLFTVIEVVIKIDPWYNPYYLIPLGGMILGNAMNTSALATERLYSEIKSHKDEIETLLSLGANVNQAISKYVRISVKASLLPIINSMMTVGLVQLPGMMTGQILSGTSPISAVKYQIVTMYMWIAGAAIACILVTILESKKYFTISQQLKKELLIK